MADLLRLVLSVILLAGPAGALCNDAGVVAIALRLDTPVPYRVELTNDGRQVSVAVELPKPATFSGGDVPCVGAVTTRTDARGWAVTSLALEGRFELQSALLQGNQISIQIRWLGPLPEEGVVTVAPATDPLPLIVIDPGHGGIDAGAVREGLKESDLVLTFARALSEALIRTGRCRVALTRNEDVFLNLSERVAFARREEAAAFISLHADALHEGEARGAAVFTLSDVASDQGAAELVAIHQRSDLMMGQDLERAGDQLAGVVLDLAMADTSPRSEALAGSLVDAMSTLPDVLRRGALRSANFGVLKAPEIPSVLVELGFLSDKIDRANLEDPAWRAAAVEALTEGVSEWLGEDAVAAGLRRH